MNPNVTNTRPCCHAVNESGTKWHRQLAHPDTVEQTMWSTLNGRHMKEDDVIEAVHKVTDDVWSSTATVGERFTDEQRNYGRPSRSY